MSTTNITTSPSIYVGTYAKYNNGSIKGKWLDLSDYEDKEAFIAACIELHNDEEDPELMFQDWEGIPSELISECSVDASLWDLMAAYEEHGQEAVDAYVSIFWEWDASGFSDRYLGEYDSMEDYAQEYIDSTGMLEQVPENLRCYFDVEKFARDLSYDIAEESGHYFSNY